MGVVLFIYLLSSWLVQIQQMERVSSKASVFHLRQSNGGTIFHLQNVNITTSTILLERLNALRTAMHPSLAATHTVIAQALSKISTLPDHEETTNDDTSGIEYFYMAMTLLSLEEHVTPIFIQLVELACKRDPASRLLKEVSRLVQKFGTQGPGVAELCSDVVRPPQIRGRSGSGTGGAARVSRQWSDSPKRGPIDTTSEGNENEEHEEDEDEEDEETSDESGTDDILMVRRKTLRRVHDRLRLGLFLTANQLQHIDDALYANVCHGTKREEGNFLWLCFVSLPSE